MKRRWRHGQVEIPFTDHGIQFRLIETYIRHLAETWESEMHPATSSRANKLSSIDLFVLFDLLGDSNPRVPSYFPTTHWAYASMSKIEKQLRNHGLALTGRSQDWLIEGDKYDTKIYKGGIEDDHIHFLRRGVEILHIIPVSFLYVLTNIGSIP